MRGRKKRPSGYISAAFRRAKNLGTRRTKVAIAQRDLRRAAATKKNKRLGK